MARVPITAAVIIKGVVLSAPGLESALNLKVFVALSKLETLWLRSSISEGRIVQRLNLIGTVRSEDTYSWVLLTTAELMLNLG